MPSPTPRLRLALSLAPFAALAVIAACSSSSQARTCTVNADCASGQCRADGTCAPIDGTGEAGTTSDGGSDTDGSIADAGTDSPAIPLLDSGLCTPNADGIITAEEVPLRAGLKGTFRVTTSGAQISTAGTVAEGGATHNWDFSGNLTGDHSVVVETIPLAGQWLETEFSGAGYASRLSDKADYLGVFAVTPGALELRGVVSPSSGSSQTKIKYDPVVPSLSFPLQKGKKWTVKTTASGDIPATLNQSYIEEYEFEVDAEGELKTSTSLGAFKVMRVSVKLAKQPFLLNPLVHYYTRQYVYVAECFGAIAKVVSKIDESSPPPDDFTDTSEIQRLSP